MSSWPFPSGLLTGSTTEIFSTIYMSTVNDSDVEKPKPHPHPNGGLVGEFLVLTVDGRNPAPLGMYKTLEIMGQTTYYLA